jgi:hypothetical protein
MRQPAGLSPATPSSSEGWPSEFDYELSANIIHSKEAAGRAQDRAALPTLRALLEQSRDEKN